MGEISAFTGLGTSTGSPRSPPRQYELIASGIHALPPAPWRPRRRPLFCPGPPSEPHESPWPWPPWWSCHRSPGAPAEGLATMARRRPPMCCAGPRPRPLPRASRERSRARRAYTQPYSRESNPTGGSAGPLARLTHSNCRLCVACHRT